MSKFKVKTHHWFEGVLHAVEHEFEKLEEAMGFSRHREQYHDVKVYDHEGEVVHSTKAEFPTYA